MEYKGVIMKLSFIRDDVLEVYRDCDDVDYLKRVLMDMRNEVIRLRLEIERLKDDQ